MNLAFSAGAGAASVVDAAIPRGAAGLQVEAPLQTSCNDIARIGSPPQPGPEAQLLEMVAAGCPLAVVLEALCRLVEAQISDECHCGVVLVEEDGRRFRGFVAPNLPECFKEALPWQGLVSKELPCALEACLKSQVVAVDLQSDSRWKRSEFARLALSLGQRSCWSAPVVSREGAILGSFALLQRELGFPTGPQQQVISRAAHLAAIAIERAQRDAKQTRNETFLAQTQLLTSTGSFCWHTRVGEFACSEQLYRIFGIDSKEPVKFGLIRSRVHPEDLPSLRRLLVRARREGGDVSQRLRLQMPEGSVRFLHVAAHATGDSHRGWNYIGTVRDETQRREIEERLRETRFELTYLARVMSLGALAASIAHEIKQPLSGIITNASTCLRMLAGDIPDIAGARDTARRTLRDGNRASDVITRLRALFAKESAADEPVDLNQIALEAIALSLSDLRRRRISVETDLAPGLPTMKGDRVQLHQVVLNLILNAADAMGGVDDRPRRLKIRSQLEGADAVRLSVQDTGTGIGPHASRLFEPFYTTKCDGMGIGLSISHAIVASHGGRLWAAPNVGPGATFCFCLPRAHSNADYSVLCTSEHHSRRMSGSVLPTIISGVSPQG